MFARDESYRKRFQRVLSEDCGTRWGGEERWGLPQKTKKHRGDRSSTAPLNETSRSHEVRVGAASKEFPFHTRIFGTRAKLSHQRNLRPDAERDISAGILPPPPPPPSPAAPTCCAVLRPLQPSRSPCRLAPGSSRGPELSLAHPESPPSPACLLSQRPLSATERTRGWRRQVAAASWQGRSKV